MSTRVYTEADRAKKAAYYLANKVKIDARSKAWREANPGRATANRRNWVSENKEQKAARARASYDRNRLDTLARKAKQNEELVDSIVRSRFCRRSGLQPKDVPEALVPAIRMSLLVSRELKSQKENHEL